jgi:hypothetical protein
MKAIVALVQTGCGSPELLAKLGSIKRWLRLND